MRQMAIDGRLLFISRAGHVCLRRFDSSGLAMAMDNFFLCLECGVELELVAADLVFDHASGLGLPALAFRVREPSGDFLYHLGVLNIEKRAFVHYRKCCLPSSAATGLHLLVDGPQLTIVHTKVGRKDPISNRLVIVRGHGPSHLRTASAGAKRSAVGVRKIDFALDNQWPSAMSCLCGARLGRAGEHVLLIFMGREGGYGVENSTGHKPAMARRSKRPTTFTIPAFAQTVRITTLLMPPLLCIGIAQ